MNLGCRCGSAQQQMRLPRQAATAAESDEGELTLGHSRPRAPELNYGALEMANDEALFIDPYGEAAGVGR